MPVQEWIEEARRSRDLRVGSVLLGFLMAKVLRALQGAVQAEIVLPSLPDGPSDDFPQLADAPSFADALKADVYGIPNRASGYCLANGDDEVASAFGALEAEVLRRWEELRDTYLANLDTQSRSPEFRRFWRSLQPYLEAYLKETAGGVDCPFSLVWVAERLSEARANPVPLEILQSDLARIDEKFRLIKHSRPVRPWVLGAPVGKCNQCGKREAIGPRLPEGDKPVFAAWRDWHQAQAGEEWLKKGYRLDAGERLCYVCLLKRLAGYDDDKARSVRSTGEVAADPWLLALRAVPDLRSGIDNLERACGKQFDLGRALFLADRKLREIGEGKVADARRALTRKITQHNERIGRGSQLPLPLRPPSYLALFTFDGDRMGDSVRDSPIEVPAKMNRFASRAKKLLAEQRAEVFYLGGDEGLAMVPAEPALKTALAMREVFREIFGSSVTLSMGMVFFEQSQPMAGAIRAAHSVLHRAKELSGRDSLGVAVETASGSRWESRARWPGWSWLPEALKWIESDELSVSWAYDVEAFLEGILDESWGEDLVRRAATEEARRLFFRRLRPHAEGRITSERRRAMKEGRWRALGGSIWWDPGAGKVPSRDPARFHLLGFLARQAAVVVSDRGAEG
jgi:hypothetical protein